MVAFDGTIFLIPMALMGCYKKVKVTIEPGRRKATDGEPTSGEPASGGGVRIRWPNVRLRKGVARVARFQRGEILGVLVICQLRFLRLRTFGHATAAAIFAVTTVCEHFDGESSFHTRAKISLSLLRHHILPQSAEFFFQGFTFPSFFWGFIGSRPSKDSAASPDNLKDKSRANEDVSKCGPGCLGRDAIANAAAAAGPAVVNIYVSRGTHGFWLGKSMGSGTIIDSDGTILTCAHIVVDFEGMRSISKGNVDVTLQDGREFEGVVISADIHSDIAVVKINPKTPISSAKLGSSSKLRPGDWVIAMGCPLSLQNTVTAGIVSCVDRKSSDLGLGGIHREYVQTDCAINEGNSGGPLVNLDGEVVGINILKVLNADGVSFAVPIDAAVKIMDNLLKRGRVIRPWLGLKMLDLNSMVITQLKERDPSFPDVIKGILVPMVTPASPAEHAGFRPGDVVIEFDGKSVSSIKEVIEIMGDKVGVPIKVVLKRANNKLVILTVVPEEATRDRS